MFDTVFFFVVIKDSRKPLVAAVEGLALGGGLELAMVWGLFQVYFPFVLLKVIFFFSFCCCCVDCSVTRNCLGVSCSSGCSKSSTRLTRADTWDYPWFWRYRFASSARSSFNSVLLSNQI